MEKDLIPQAMFLPDALEPAVSGSVLDGVAVDLTQVEFRLLSLLASEPGRVFTRSELLRSLYTDHRVVCDRTIDTHVKNLRRKLRVRFPKRFVRTWYGLGYMLDLSASTREEKRPSARTRVPAE